MSGRADRTPRQSRAQVRQAIWDAMRAQGGALFSVRQIADAARREPRTVSSYLECLCAGQRAERIDDLELGVRYRLIGSPPIVAPRLNRQGEDVTMGRGVANMWRTMRMLTEFTSRDLAAHATTDEVGVSEQTAKRYCTALHRAGYLRAVVPGGPGKHAVWRLIRNTGPSAPMIQRVRQVYDPNDQSVHPLEAA